MSFKKLFYSLALVLATACGASAQSHGGGIHWMSITEAYQQMLRDTVKKKVFIDVYTQWCGWCKRMDASTFEDPMVVAYLNSRYYPVKLDAEIKDTIVLGDKTFVYKPEARANEVAIALLQQKMSYPTSIFLDETFNMLTPVPGYQTSEQIIPILRYFGENIYRTLSWENYEKNGYKQ